MIKKSYFIIKQLFKSVICRIVSFSGILFIYRILSHRDKKISILMYHSISNSFENEVSVKLDEFKKQMEYLAKNYNVIKLEEAVQYIRNGEIAKNRLVVITFDDGYKDNYYNACPVLTRLKLPATIFLLLEYIETSKKWPPGDERGSGEFDNLILSWQEIIEMSKNGISFGGHTVTHPVLSRVFGDKLFEEVNKPKMEIQRRLGLPVRAFSYPLGTSEEVVNRVTEVVKDCGYSCACSAIIGGNHLGSDLFSLKRIGIERSDTMYVFRKKLDGALDVLCIKDTYLGKKIKDIIASIFGVKSFAQRYYGSNKK